MVAQTLLPRSLHGRMQQTHFHKPRHRPSARDAARDKMKRIAASGGVPAHTFSRRYAPRLDLPPVTRPAFFFESSQLLLQIFLPRASSSLTSSHTPNSNALVASVSRPALICVASSVNPEKMSNTELLSSPSFSQCPSVGGLFSCCPHRLGSMFDVALH